LTSDPAGVIRATTSVNVEQRAMYEIERGVNPPPAPGVKYPFARLKINESFFVLGKTPRDLNGSVAHWTRKLRRRFTLRRIANEENGGGGPGVRVWRVR
jgi:hypothetical protein